jgi:WD repeat-containing protein 7
MQIYDAGDFSLLCSESSRRGERWTGGEFVSVDRVVVWSNEGRGYLYKLPTKYVTLVM